MPRDDRHDQLVAFDNHKNALAKVKPPQAKPRKNSPTTPTPWSGAL
jgi:hypothetical protein